VTNYCENEATCEKLIGIKKELDSYQHTAEERLEQISNFNIMYERLVNELSTIINVFEYINLVTDYKNLFTLVSDMLVGILGLKNCSVFIYENGNYRIETSCLPRRESIKMKSVIDDYFERNGEPKETVILKEEDLLNEFSVERGINAAVIIPLIGKDSKTGLIYIEHEKAGYFEANSLKYLNTLGIAIRLSLENAKLYSRLEEIAMVDSLTQLYNRLYFNKEISLCIENYKKFNLKFVLVLMDIDHFKRINDTYGHLCGDQVLIDISSILKENLRHDDMVCRFGGEEFAIIFRNTEDIDGIMNRLKKLKDEIEMHETIYQNKKVRVSASFGIGILKADKNDDISDSVIINDADSALYTAKHEGRNMICTSDHNCVR